MFTVFCRDEEVLSDKVPVVVSEQNEGDFVGVIEIVGLDVVDGLLVGSNVGNLGGRLLGA